MLCLIVVIDVLGLPWSFGVAMYGRIEMLEKAMDRLVLQW